VKSFLRFLLDVKRCGIRFQLVLSINKAVIYVEAINVSSTKDDLQDTVLAQVSIKMGHDNVNLSLSLTIEYRFCSSDKCNDEIGLKNILRSLAIEE